MKKQKHLQMQRRVQELEFLSPGSAPICKVCEQALEIVCEVTLQAPDGIMNFHMLACLPCRRGYLLPMAEPILFSRDECEKST